MLKLLKKISLPSYLKRKLNQILIKVQNTLILRNITLIDSLDTLKILTFWKIIKDKNIFILDIDYKDGKKYTKKEIENIEKLWFKLYDEYYLLLDDTRARQTIKKSFDELALRDKINQVKYNYDFLISLLKFGNEIKTKEYEQEVYHRLKLIDSRIKPKYFEGIEANLRNLDRVLKSLINKYNIEHKTNDIEIQKEIDNVYDVVSNAESWLERTLPIDEIVCSRWISYQKQIKLKQKANQKNGK